MGLITTGKIRELDNILRTSVETQVDNSKLKVSALLVTSGINEAFTGSAGKKSHKTVRKFDLIDLKCVFSFIWAEEVPRPLFI